MSENNKGISFALGYQVNISKRSENEPGTDAVILEMRRWVDAHKYQLASINSISKIPRSWYFRNLIY
jgi:hypothetical protein